MHEQGDHEGAIREAANRKEAHDLAKEYTAAICPHCKGLLCPKRTQLGETILCDKTGKEFVIEEFISSPLPNSWDVPPPK
jgi:type II secretory ATPase GspE/PulE/Tfp pilus assembly ATPase PilB-like protein